METHAITVTDVFIFAFGIVAGVAFGYCVGKLVFSQLFKKQEDAITVENVGKFTAVQQGLNYLLGFALGAATLSPHLGVVLLLFWLGIQRLEEENRSNMSKCICVLRGCRFLSKFYETARLFY